MTKEEIIEFSEMKAELESENEDIYEAIIKALEQEPDTWSLEDAREDFMEDVYNTLDFLLTNDEANQIIDSFDRVTSSIRREPCEDCISREAVLDLAKKGVLISNGNYESVCKAINDLPSVTPKYTNEEIDRAQAVEQAYIDKMVELVAEKAKRPKGKWEYVQYDYNPNIGSWHCSECRFMFVMSGVPEYKYCPNCGARMIESEEEE